MTSVHTGYNPRSGGSQRYGGSTESQTVPESEGVLVIRKNNGEVIEVPVDSLPAAYETTGLLEMERCSLQYWNRAAIAYYSVDRGEEAIEVLQQAARATNVPAEKSDRARVHTLMGIVQLERAMDLVLGRSKDGEGQSTKKSKEEYLQDANTEFTKATAIDADDVQLTVARGVMQLLRSSTAENDKAQQTFSSALRQNPRLVPALLGRAVVRFQKKNYEGALNDYRYALRSAGSDKAVADIRVGVGICAFQLERYGLAERAFNRVLVLDANNVSAKLGLALIQMNRKTNEGNQEGVKILRSAYDVEPTNSLLLCHLANHFFYRRDFGKALTLATVAQTHAESNERQGEACYQQARAYHAQGQLDKALRFYYQAVKMNEDHMLARFGLAQMFMREDKKDVAKAIEQLLAIHRKQGPTYEVTKLLGSLYASTHPPQVAKATEFLKQAVEKTPEDLECLIELAAVQENTDAREALKTYELIIRTVVESGYGVPPVFHNNSGVMHFRLEQYEQALKSFRAALKELEELQEDADEAENATATDNVDAADAEDQADKKYAVTIRFNIARACEALHLWDDAKKAYESLLEDFPSYGSAQLRMGFWHLEQGDKDAALKVFEEIAAKTQKRSSRLNDTTHADAVCMQGNILLQQQRWTDAQQRFDSVRNRARDDEYASVQLGNIYLRSASLSPDPTTKEKRLARAYQLFSDVLKKHKRNIFAANGLGVIIAESGEDYLNDAKNVFMTIREATGEQADVWINLATVCTELGSHQQAVALYTRTLKRFFANSPQKSLLLMIARANYLMNSYKDALLSLEHAQHLDPNDKGVATNICLVQQQIAQSILEQQTQSVEETNQALKAIELSIRSLNTLFNSVQKLEETLKKNPSEVTGNPRDTKPFDGASRRRFLGVDSKQIGSLAKRGHTLYGRVRKMVESAKRNQQHVQELARQQEEKRQELLARKQREKEEEEARKREVEAKHEEILRKLDEEAEELKEKVKSTAATVKSRSGGGRRRRKEDMNGFIESEDDSDASGVDYGAKRDKKSKGKRKPKRMKQTRLYEGSDASDSEDESDMSEEDADDDVTDSDASGDDSQKKKRRKSKKRRRRSKKRRSRKALDSDDDEVDDDSEEDRRPTSRLRRGGGDRGRASKLTADVIEDSDEEAEAAGWVKPPAPVAKTDGDGDGTVDKETVEESPKRTTAKRVVFADDDDDDDDLGLDGDGDNDEPPKPKRARVESDDDDD
eukprot:Clim_evm124s109 gene=Clim_evmTU124s109